jgi:uncharacterized protein YkwD
MPRQIAAFLFALTVLSAAAYSQNNQQNNAVGVSSVVNVDYVRPRVVAATDPSTIASTEREVFALINKKRADAGLDALRWNDELAELARQHSDDMARFKYFSHRGNDGTMVDDRADKIGLGSWQAIGENIAFERGFDDAASFAVEQWMESPEHKRNLLDKRWKESGIGVAILPDGTYYFTQVFLLRD